MIERPTDPPDFRDPPVVETVLSVQFDRLTAARTAHFGLYWNEVHERFPKTEERGELQAVFEREAERPNQVWEFNLKRLRLRRHRVSGL